MPVKTRHINLALQGGGTHGAFTWGVLDRLLDEPTIEIAAISGTSAGALNGAALKGGLKRGGRTEARRNLDDLWSRVGAVTDPRLADWMQAVMPPAVSRALDVALPFAALDAAARLFSPYDTGPFYSNPLRGVVEDLCLGDVCGGSELSLHVCATNVRTGKIRVFSNADVSVDALLASACLPTLFRAVEIPDPQTGTIEAYWDGGYTGNPALFPLFDPALPADIIIVNINPLHRDALPRTAQQIQNRINEISFNTSLLRELRAIEFVQRLLDQHQIDEESWKRVLVHMIADDELMNRLSVATKLIPIPSLMHELKTAGQQAAEEFLQQHASSLNQRGTVDLVAMFA